MCTLKVCATTYIHSVYLNILLNTWISYLDIQLGVFYDCLLHQSHQLHLWGLAVRQDPVALKQV